MSDYVWWAVFGIPLVAMVVSWQDIFRHWDADGQRILRALAAVFPTAAALVGCGALLYVEGVGASAGMQRSRCMAMVYFCAYRHDLGHRGHP